MFQQEDLNFLLTNRIPRRLLTRFVGWLSKIEQPLVRDLSIGLWKAFSGLDLSEAKKSSFRSMHDCFIRELKDGARPVDGRSEGAGQPLRRHRRRLRRDRRHAMLQVKGFPYTCPICWAIRELVEAYRNGRYVTLRLTSSMYHRFHAPHDCRVEQVTYISGDTWNVNPVALKRIEKLFCKNERAVIRTTLAAGGHRRDAGAGRGHAGRQHPAAFPRRAAAPSYRGPNVIPCNAPLRKGEEMGWFEHGSTIIVFAPESFALCEGVTEGASIRMGEPLMRLP